MKNTEYRELVKQLIDQCSDREARLVYVMLKQIISEKN